MLPDDVWRETMIRAALENKSASDICEQVLRHYIDSPETDRPPIRVKRASGRLYMVGSGYEAQLAENLRWN